jgi:hypothetical protein
MTHADDLAVIARLERLERQQRRWRGAAVAGALGLAALALMGQKPAGRTVEAERFVLRDGAGRVRAELMMVDGTEQSVALRFKDADGMPRLTVGTENGAALLVLNEAGGKLRAGLVVLPHGAPGLNLYDGGGKPRAELSLNRDGAPALTFNDRDGFATWKTTGR